jgi:hypothetical protein
MEPEPAWLYYWIRRILWCWCWWWPPAVRQNEIVLVNYVVAHLEIPWLHYQFGICSRDETMKLLKPDPLNMSEFQCRTSPQLTFLRNPNILRWIKFAKQPFLPHNQITLCRMARRQHDQPNPELIVEGSRKVQPSKRVQGEDYPTTLLEELGQRNKGTTYISCADVASSILFLFNRYSYSNDSKFRGRCNSVLFEDRRWHSFLLQGRV